MTGTPAGRQTFAVIDTAALAHNFAHIRARVAPEVGILAVVKANAYGHGATLVAPVLDQAGAAAFGVATVGEAVELRNAGIDKPILVLGGAAARDMAALQRFRLSVALLDGAMARDLAEGARGARLRVHLKIDSGMGRLGVLPRDVPALLDVVRQAGCFDVEGVFSHFGDADDVSTPHCDAQVANFHQALQAVVGAGLAPTWVHLANSAAALTRPDTHFNLVRPGIALYGLTPPCAGDVGLRPVMRLVTHVLQVRELDAGVPVSYAQRFTTTRPSRIAVLPIGYADGYSRLLTNRAQVLVRGQRVPVVGTVCMDLTMVDVTDLGDVGPGEEVVLWGEQGGARIDADEVGQWQGSIGYEVLNRVGKRVPRLVASGQTNLS